MTAQILEYLETGKTLTNEIAKQEIGENYLVRKIFRLREKGYNIKTVMLPGVSVDGRRIKIAHYQLDDSPQEVNSNVTRQYVENRKFSSLMANFDRLAIQRGAV